MKSWLVIFILTSAPAFAARAIVSTAAQGVRTPDGALYLLDLWEYGRHLQPAMGGEISATARFGISNKSLYLVLPKLDLLWRKLTDIERDDPTLAAGVIAVINDYRWRFTPRKLPPDAIDHTVTNLPNHAFMVPLAEQIRNTVWLQKLSWPDLSPENQIALIVHVAVNRIIHLQCADGSCANPRAVTREIVATLFSPLDQLSPQLSPLKLFP